MPKYVLNYMELYEIDITPNGTSRTYKPLREGITGATPTLNEVVDQTSYFSGNGYGSSFITGGQLTIAFSGHRAIGDAAQDYIFGVQLGLGQARETNFRWTDSQGVQKSGKCTIASIESGSGDASAKNEISFEIHLNGEPALTPKVPASALSIAVAGGTVSGTTKVTATVTEGNSLRYSLTAVSRGVFYANQYLDQTIAYVSASDIQASVGQFLTAFEVDTNGRIVKYAEQELEVGDITA